MFILSETLIVELQRTIEKKQLTLKLLCKIDYALSTDIKHSEV